MYWCRPLDVPPDCWQVDPENRAYASFHLDGVEYGVDDVVVGRVIIIADWTLSGAAILARPIQVRNTQATTSTVFRGYVMDGGRNVVGATRNRCKDGRFGATPAGELRQWTPRGCTQYDNQGWDHESVIEVRWQVVGYAGYWYLYLKSPVAHSSDKQYYTFTDHPPGLPFGAGHAG